MNSKHILYNGYIFFEREKVEKFFYNSVVAVTNKKYVLVAKVLRQNHVLASHYCHYSSYHPAVFNGALFRVLLFFVSFAVSIKIGKCAFY